MKAPPTRLIIAVAVLIAGALPVAACTASPTPVAGAASTQIPSPSQATSSTPPGDTPSASAKMICQPEAATEIASALGVHTSKPPTPSWTDHVYSCRYVYPAGVIVLSIKELPDADATTAYYTAAQHSLTSNTPVQVLGQNGFAAPDGSIYVRKDFKVLHVDVSGIPDHFGQPPYTRGDAAFTVAAVIMSCWTGN